MQVFGMYSGYLSKWRREGRSRGEVELCSRGALRDALRGALFELLLSVAFSSFLAGLTDFPETLALASAMTLLPSLSSPRALPRASIRCMTSLGGPTLESEANRVREEGLGDRLRVVCNLSSTSA